MLIVSDTFVVAGISFNNLQLFCRLKLPKNSQIYLSKLPNSFCTSKSPLTFVTEAATFKQFRKIPSFHKGYLLFRINIFCDLLGFKIIIKLWGFSANFCPFSNYWMRSFADRITKTPKLDTLASTLKPPSIFAEEKLM